MGACVRAVRDTEDSDEIISDSAREGDLDAMERNDAVMNSTLSIEDAQIDSVTGKYRSTGGWHKCRYSCTEKTKADTWWGHWKSQECFLAYDGTRNGDYNLPDCQSKEFKSAEK